MANGIACGRVRTTATDSRNMPAVLQIMGFLFSVYFFDIGHPCYDQLTPLKTRYHVTISRNQVYSSSRPSVFLRLIADQVLVFRLDRGLMSG